MLLKFGRSVRRHVGRWDCGLDGGFWKGSRRIYLVISLSFSSPLRRDGKRTSSPQQASHWEISAASHNDSGYLPSELCSCGIAVEGGG
jgi:hypothetical protein